MYVLRTWRRLAAYAERVQPRRGLPFGFRGRPALPTARTARPAVAALPPLAVAVRGPRGGPRPAGGRWRSGTRSIGRELLHLLARADRIAFLQKSREGSRGYRRSGFAVPWAGRRRSRWDGSPEHREAAGWAARPTRGLSAATASMIAENRIGSMTSFAAFCIFDLIPPLVDLERKPLPKSPPHMSVRSPQERSLPSSTSTRSGFNPCSRRSRRRAWLTTPFSSQAMASTPPAARVPAPLVLSRVAQSSFLRESRSTRSSTPRRCSIIGRRLGARVLNGADVLAIDSSKARQLSLITSLGYSVPETRVVHRARDLATAAEDIAFPLLIKANIGGSGAGITRYSSAGELHASIADRTVPQTVDHVLLVQDYVPPPAGRSSVSRRSAGIFSMPSKSRAKVTVSTSAPPTPASPSRAAARSA